MDNKLLHTPEGVRDIYNTEFAKKLAVEDKIKKILYLYGYQGIETPTFEFFDIFSKDRGSVDTREMYKFFDRNNNTLVLRPDITPSIARCAAKYYMDEDMPIRLCYLEKTYINNSSYQGRLKETTQTGAELIGDASSDADAEMIAMVIDSLKSADLKEFQVEIGQVEFFRGLVEEAGMDKDAEDELRVLIENKNYFGVEELVNNYDMSDKLRMLFLKIPELFGNIDKISEIKHMTDNKRALKAIDRLEKIWHIIENYGLSEYVSFDLGMLSNFDYYTGIIFKGYTYGTGEYIVTGGRYDKLLIQFGKDAPAVGFAINIDLLMMALSRQDIDTQISTVNTIVLYDISAQTQAINLAKYIRKNNLAVQMIRKSLNKTLADYMNYSKRNCIRNILYLEDDGESIQMIDINNGSKEAIPYNDYCREV